MDYVAGPKLHHLDRAVAEARVLKLTNARGARVVCIAGDVWVTEDGRYDDVVLAAGESAVLERDGTAMITPFGSADVEVVLPVAAQAARYRHLRIDAALIERQVLAARRLRAQTIAALCADAIAWMHERGRDLLQAYAGKVRARRTARTLEGLSDHILRDIGFQRDQITCSSGRVRASRY